MAKFGSNRDAGYKAIKGEIFKWVRRLRSGGQQTSSSDLQEG
jgi:hypothetical protein